MLNKNILNVDDLGKYCTGCGACYLVCSIKAIKYELNEVGFYSAKVDREKCVGCGKCLRVCSKNFSKDMVGSIKDKQTYAACSKDKSALKKSTSGAIAYEIAKDFISRGDLVFGTEFNLQDNKCKLIKVSTDSELQKIQGSKYIQSNTVEGFEEAVRIARKESDRNFLIFGTPCQIYGLNKVLEIENLRDRFTCVEVFCHGVPSKLLWDRYLQEFKEKNNIQEDISKINFRNKVYGWHMYTMGIGTDDRDYYVTSDASDFYRIYFEHTALNKACISCGFREEYSAADIRLGDFWGNEFIENNTGVSAVVILTEKGKCSWNKIKNRIDILGSYDSEECIKYQSTNEYKIDKNLIDEVLKLLQGQLSLKKIVKLYRKQFRIKERIRLSAKDFLSKFPVDLKIKMKHNCNLIRNRLRG